MTKLRMTLVLEESCKSFVLLKGYTAPLGIGNSSVLLSASVRGDAGEVNRHQIYRVSFVTSRQYRAFL